MFPRNPTDTGCQSSSALKGLTRAFDETPEASTSRLRAQQATQPAKRFKSEGSSQLAGEFDQFMRGEVGLPILPRVPAQPPQGYALQNGAVSAAGSRPVCPPHQEAQAQAFELAFSRAMADSKAEQATRASTQAPPAEHRAERTPVKAQAAGEQSANVVPRVHVVTRHPQGAAVEGAFREALTAELLKPKNGKKPYVIVGAHDLLGTEGNWGLDMELLLNEAFRALFALDIEVYVVNASCEIVRPREIGVISAMSDPMMRPPTEEAVEEFLEARVSEREGRVALEDIVSVYYDVLAKHFGVGYIDEETVPREDLHISTREALRAPAEQVWRTTHCHFKFDSCIPEMELYEHLVKMPNLQTVTFQAGSTDQCVRIPPMPLLRYAEITQKEDEAIRDLTLEYVPAATAIAFGVGELPARITARTEAREQLTRFLQSHCDVMGDDLPVLRLFDMEASVPPDLFKRPAPAASQQVAPRLIKRVAWENMPPNLRKMAQPKRRSRPLERL